jgi:uncharacterized membrane protein YdfJ with MMPL/SSD domain
MSKSGKILGAVVLTAVFASPLAMAMPQWTSVFSVVSSLSTGTFFVPVTGSPVTTVGSTPSDYFSLIGRTDPASPS